MQNFGCKHPLLQNKIKNDAGGALAEKAGITSVGISKIETGKTWPKKETIEKFLEILEVKPFQLFTETKEDFLKYKNIVTETISELVDKTFSEQKNTSKRNRRNFKLKH